jgi:hypothetical protein
VEKIVLIRLGLRQPRPLNRNVVLIRLGLRQPVLVLASGIVDKLDNEELTIWKSEVSSSDFA